MEANKQNAQMFLNKINWMANTSKVDVVSFGVDVYEFQFDKPLDHELLKDFTGFLRVLPMNKLQSVFKIWIWLYQHEVGFKLRFAWNGSLSILYNIRNLRGPKKIDKRLRACNHEDLMAYKFKE